jgi:hypothetical protein
VFEGVFDNDEVFHLYEFVFRFVSKRVVLSEPKNWALDDL